MLAVAPALGAACGGDAPEGAPGDARACRFVVWHEARSDAAYVEIVGSFGGWRRPGRALRPSAEGGPRVDAVEVPPGTYDYALVEDGVWLTDRHVGLGFEHEGREVSRVRVPDCRAPAVRVDAVELGAGDVGTVRATLVMAEDRAALDPGSVEVRDLAGRAVPFERLPAEGGGPQSFAVRLREPVVGKTTVRIVARDARGREAEGGGALATVWSSVGGGTAWDPRDAVVYQVMVDRFRRAPDEGGLPGLASAAGGTPGVLARPEPPSARAGGTLDGVRAALEEGYFASFGADVLWLSPLYLNPEGDFPGTDGRPYSSYHGYWPVDPRAVDPRLGGDAALERLVAAAHARGVRVVVDVVPNHVHEQSVYRAEHDDWFRTSCVCGQPGCDWGGNIQTCQFAPYLLDVDWSKNAVHDRFGEDMRFWLDRFDVDGLRLDAVPMVPRWATRRILDDVRARHEQPGHPLYLLGENFTGPGGVPILRYDLGEHGLDGSFHFPLMWATRYAIAEDREPLSSIEDVVRAGDAEWEGSGAVMGLMIGNHDVNRFASVAAREGDGDGWVAAPQPTDERVYARQALALSVVFTLPGAPVVYYGDEVGLAGRMDPDSRRPMPSEAELSAPQRALREHARALGRARREHAALRRGTTRWVSRGAELLAYARELPEAPDETVLVLVARRPEADESLTLPTDLAGTWRDVLSGETLELAPGSPPPLAPRRAWILRRAPPS